MPDPRREAHPDEEAPERARVPGRLALEDPERAVRAALLRGVHDGARPLGDPLPDRERAELVARLEILGGGDALVAQLAQARVDLGARGEDGVEQRLHGVDLDAAVRQRAGERRLGRAPADVRGGKAEEIPRQGHQLLEREEPFELTAHDIDRHEHSSEPARTPQGGRRARMLAGQGGRQEGARRGSCEEPEKIWPIRRGRAMPRTWVEPPSWSSGCSPWPRWWSRWSGPPC